MANWSTGSDGYVTINGQVPTLTNPAQLSIIHKVITQWYDLAKENADRTGVPVALILAIIFQESGGNANARSPGVGALGLMQLFSQNLKQGYSDDDVMIPEINIKLGSDALRDILVRTHGDIINASILYNAGSKRVCTENSKPEYCQNNLGYQMNDHYSEMVAAANNTIIPLVDNAAGSGSDTWLVLVALGFAGWVGWKYYYRQQHA